MNRLTPGTGPNDFAAANNDEWEEVHDPVDPCRPILRRKRPAAYGDPRVQELLSIAHCALDNAADDSDYIRGLRISLDEVEARLKEAS